MMTFRRFPLFMKKRTKMSGMSLLVLISGVVWILSSYQQLRESTISLEDNNVKLKEGDIVVVTKEKEQQQHRDSALLAAAAASENPSLSSSYSPCNDSETLLTTTTTTTIECDKELLLSRNRTNEEYLQTFFNNYDTKKNSTIPIAITGNNIRNDNNNINNTSNAITPRRRREPLRLVHVWSPFVLRPSKKKKKKDINGNTTSSSQSFAPLNQAQNVTWESMYRAQQYVLDNVDPSQLQVQIYCAILWMDVDILQAHEPPLCRPDNTIVLNRSSATEHPQITPLIHLPIVQDMIDPIISNNNVTTTKPFDYMILTNSDIALVEPFYILAATSILKYGYEAFVVNRRTISKGPSGTNNNNTSTTDDDLDRLWTSKAIIPHLQRDEIFNYEPHPGTDCYFMRRDVVQSIHLGKLFLGHPPWAKVLQHTLQDIMAVESFVVLPSKFGWTYHLGNDQTWKIKQDDIDNTNNDDDDDGTTTTDSTTTMEQLVLFSDEQQEDIMTRCIYANRGATQTLHFLQNTKNCADLFDNHQEAVRAIYAVPLNDDDNDTIMTANFELPPFVLNRERFVRGIRVQQQIDEEIEQQRREKEIEEEKQNPLLFSSLRTSYADVFRVYQDQYIANITKDNKDNNKNKAPGPLRIVHVWSPYVVGTESKNQTDYNDSNNTSSSSLLFAPLDQAQNITWESLYRAQSYAKEHVDESYLSVQIYCAILWTDVDILQAHEPPLCQPDNTIVLKRSTATEFVKVTPKIHYPFIQDMMDPFAKKTDDDDALNNATADFDYLILTNSDISVVEPFYILVATAIRMHGYDAFVVNRRGISKRNEITQSPWTSNDIPHLESKERLHYTPHPGTDCFIMRSDVLRSFDLGNLFLGSPPWAKVLRQILNVHMAESFHVFLSQENGGWTYHLGNDQEWRKKPRIGKNNALFDRTTQRQIKRQCVFGTQTMGEDPIHTVQNTYNCAKIFKYYSKSMDSIIATVEDNTNGGSKTKRRREYPTPGFVVDEDRFVQSILRRHYLEKLNATAAHDSPE